MSNSPTKYGLQSAPATRERIASINSETDRFAKRVGQININMDAAMASEPNPSPQFQSRPVVPWASNPAYGNADPNTRSRIAERYDPTSWATVTRTPGEINQQVGDRTKQHLAGLRQSNFDPYAARAQGQYSPVNGAGVKGLPDLTAQREAERQQRVSQYRDQNLARDQRIATDPTAQARWQAMNSRGGTDAPGPIDPGQYRAQLGEATMLYNTYSRAARMSGQSPMTYDTFLSQYGSNNLSPEVQGLLQQGRQINQQVSASQRQPRLGPNLQASQYLNQRYGIPMAMPRDPAVAQNWKDSLAMQGNPYAAQSNLYDQQAMAGMARTNADNMAQLQRTMAEQAGQNYRTGLQTSQGTQLSPEQRSQVVTHWTKADPIANKETTIRGYVSDAQKDGRWDANGGADRQRIMQEANTRGEEAARQAMETRRMLAQDSVFGPIVGGAGAMAQMPPQSQYGLTPPPTQPAPLSQGSPFWMGGAKVPQRGTAADTYGINLLQNLPPSTPPTNAGPDDLFGAYAAVKQALNGQEPTIKQVQNYLRENSNKNVRPFDNNSVRPYWEYRNTPAQGQSDSAYNQSYLDWLEANRQALGAAPKEPMPSASQGVATIATSPLF